MIAERRLQRQIRILYDETGNRADDELEDDREIIDCDGKDGARPNVAQDQQY